MDTVKASVLALCLIAISYSGNAAVYKIIDEKTGQITFTDKPSPSEKPKVVNSVDLPPINTQPAIKLPEKTTLPQSDEQLYFAKYRSFEVSQPKDQSTIPPGQLNLIIQLKTQPQLQNGHRIQLHFDNQKHGKPATATSFNIDKLIRGAHNISASIINEKGKTIISTQTITVFVHRNSVRN